MKIHQNLAVNHLVFPKLSLFYATFVVRTIILPPIVMQEPQASEPSLCRFGGQWSVSQSRRGQGLDPKLQRAERADEQGWIIVWFFLFSFQDKQTV